MTVKPFEKAGYGILVVIAGFLFSFPLYTLAANKIVVLLPLQVYADPSKGYLGEGIKTLLASRLAGEGLDVVTPDSVLSDADKQGVTSQKRAEEITRLLKANYAVFGSITSVGAGYSLDLSCLDLTKDEPAVTKISEVVTEDQLISKVSDIVYDFRAIASGSDIRKQRQTVPRNEEDTKGFLKKRTPETAAFKPTGSASVKAGVMALDTGDLDGDGHPEILAMSREALMIYSRKGNSLVLKETLRADLSEEFLKVSIADIDGNGRPEIYLVSFYGQRAQTSVWEWPGKFTRKLDRQRGHFHVLKNQGGGQPSLIFSDSGIDTFFMGKIHQAAYDQTGKLTRKDPLPEMKGAQFYTLTLFDYDRDGKSEYMALGEPRLDHSAQLQIWSLEGNPLAKLDEQLGGTNNYIRSGKGKANPDDQPPANLINSKIAVMDVDNDGKKEILVVANNPLAGKIDFVIYYDGSVIVFKTEGSSLVQAYESGKIKYCLTDMAVHDKTLYLSGDEGEVLNTAEGKGRIMWYE
jgi:hypothetical protein